jgi:hypothetical protein
MSVSAAPFMNPHPSVRIFSDGVLIPCSCGASEKKTVCKHICEIQVMHLPMSGMNLMLLGLKERTGTEVERPKSNRVDHLLMGCNDWVR